MAMTLITYAGATTAITPDVVDGYESSSASGAVVHPIAGRDNPDVTLTPGGLRRGTLRLVFKDDTASREAEAAHLLPVAFTLTSPNRDTVDMYYIATGDVGRMLDSSRRGWVVTVPFHEVAP